MFIPPLLNGNVTGTQIHQSWSHVVDWCIPLLSLAFLWSLPNFECIFNAFSIPRNDAKLKNDRLSAMTTSQFDKNMHLMEKKMKNNIMKTMNENNDLQT